MTGPVAFSRSGAGVSAPAQALPSTNPSTAKRLHTVTPSKTNHAASFLAARFQGVTTGFVNLCFKTEKGTGLITKTYDLGAYRALEAMAVKAKEMSVKTDVYFEVCPQLSAPAKGRRGQADNASCLPGVWLDIDVQGAAHKAENLPSTEAEALALVSTFPLPASHVVRSGGGIHAYWDFKEPLQLRNAADRKTARELTDRFQEFFRQPKVNPSGWKIDPTSDLARLLRVPETFNHKSKPALKVELIGFQPKRRYEVKQFEEYLPVSVARPSSVGSSARTESLERVQAWLSAVPSPAEGGRNHEANRVAYKLIEGWGYNVDGVDSFDLLQDWNNRCSPPLDLSELRTCHNSARKAIEKKGGPSLHLLQAELTAPGAARGNLAGATGRQEFPVECDTSLRVIGDPGPDPWAAQQAEEVTEEEAEEESEPDSVPWPSPMAPEALFGIVGEIVRTIEPHTESDPAAILVQTLVMAGHLIGRGPFFPVERTKHGCNENAVIVGNSSKARKGTSWSNVREIGKAALGVGLKGLQIINGLGSGEALVSAVQDRPEDEAATASEVNDRKRLLIMEQEYAHVLKVGAREGSTLSPTLRAAWDGEPISNLTKGSRLTSTGHHLSFIGHITGRELRETLPAVEAANGNANRNIFIAAKRSKFLPEGGSLTDEDVKALGDKLRQRLEWVKSIGKAPVVRDPAARWLWAQIYRSLSEGLPGLAGSILGRAEAHVTRISLLYALLDSSSVIRLDHLLAALAVWDYSVASVLYVFGSKLEVGLSDSILKQLRAMPNGMTRTELSKFLQGNKSSGEIGRALSFLEDQGLAEKVKEKSPNPQCKKPVERWKARKEQRFEAGTGYLRQAKVALESLPSDLRIYGFNEFTEITNLLGEKLL